MALKPAFARLILALPPSDRVALLKLLMDSLDPGEPDPDAEELWNDEVQAPADRYDRGETTAVDAFEALDRIERSLDQGGSR